MLFNVRYTRYGDSRIETRTMEQIGYIRTKFLSLASGKNRYETIVINGKIMRAIRGASFETGRPTNYVYVRI